MLSNKTEVLLEVALESLREDVRNAMRQQVRSGEIPCSSGLRDFERMVRLLRDLEDRVGRKSGMLAQESTIAMSMDEMPER